MSFKPTLCLDFDGVLHSYTSGWVDAMFIPDPPVEKSMVALEEYLKDFNVVIFSSRSTTPEGRKAMLLWIGYWAKKELGPARGNSVYNQLNNDVCWPTSKPPAFVTIDDRAITFKGTWPTQQEIKDFKPWNKQ